ncbi:MAG TPA: hypothetical protein VNH11_35550 [Pirellulales bacterium]|nr:hypothetical protein [Pirellulales bacterium]
MKPGRLSRSPVRNPRQPPGHAGTFLPRGPGKPAQCRRDGARSGGPRHAELADTGSGRPDFGLAEAKAGNLRAVVDVTALGESVPETASGEQVTRYGKRYGYVLVTKIVAQAISDTLAELDD